METIVFGGTGSIGRALVGAFAEAGINIAADSCSVEEHADWLITYKSADIREPKQVAMIVSEGATVVHTANLP